MYSLYTACLVSHFALLRDITLFEIIFCEVIIGVLSQVIIAGMRDGLGKLCFLAWALMGNWRNLSPSGIMYQPKMQRCTHFSLGQFLLVQLLTLWTVEIHLSSFMYKNTLNKCECSIFKIILSTEESALQAGLSINTYWQINVAGVTLLWTTTSHPGWLRNTHIHWDKLWLLWVTQNDTGLTCQRNSLFSVGSLLF